MNVYILYQNDEEMKRFKNHIPSDFCNEFNLKYFKSYIFKNFNNFNYNNFNYSFLDTYKTIYRNKLNNNQLNHLLSIKKILEDSLKHKYESIMILEYDVFFHKDFMNLFKKYDSLIKNNDIIHLGSSQHKWYDILDNSKIIIKEWKDNKYYINSHSLGTFAIILKNNIFFEYLNFINYVLTDYNYFPSDVILSIISRRYKSIVLFPNLIICDLDKSSILNKDRSNDYIKFKWYKHKYVC